MAKIIVYELNEVPWRVIDFYISQRPSSKLGTHLHSAAQITTRTNDSGELHPWSTWPTMHRGVSNQTHNINYINQDLKDAEDWPPLWRILSDNGITTGVFGALQSFPPAISPQSLFHVPDTFAPNETTYPNCFSRFQKLNLRLTGENSARASKIGTREVFEGLRLFFDGLTLSTGSRLFAHLVREKFEPRYRVRRSTMQALVSFDIYLEALRRFRPQYTSFFSNHVAGMMHRYWKHAFPEDFPTEDSKSSESLFHSTAIIEAMDIFDRQLGLLFDFAKSNGYELLVASSMGQEAVNRGEYIPELKLVDNKLLATAIRYYKPFTMNLAMQPDVALEFQSASDAAEFESLAANLVDGAGVSILHQRYPPSGNTLNLTTRTSRDAAKNKCLYLDNKPISLEKLGFELINRDPGTGYHQPEGVLLWWGEHQPDLAHREIVDSRQYAPTILRTFDIVARDYMLASM